MFQTKIERNKYWAEIKKLRQQFHADRRQDGIDQNNLLPFTEYVKLNYGFMILRTSYGDISDKFVVVDDELYFMYKLQGGK